MAAEVSERVDRLSRAGDLVDREMLDTATAGREDLIDELVEDHDRAATLAQDAARNLSDAHADLVRIAGAAHALIGAIDPRLGGNIRAPDALEHIAASGTVQGLLTHRPAAPVTIPDHDSADDGIRAAARATATTGPNA